MKQAVLIIHGVGEQRPMGTLRSFVESLINGKAYRSKPDHLNNTLELRKLTHRTEDVDTDFYEYYWAFRFRDTKYSHVFSWASDLVRSDYVPERFKRVKHVLIGAFWFVVILLLWKLATIFMNTMEWPEFIEKAQAVMNGIGVIGAVFLFFAGRLIITYAGDAARYFNSAPDNIAERQLIKGDGIKVLLNLHDLKNRKGEPKYDRIIVVGHSLGSVVGYDILKHAWIQFNKDIHFDERKLTDEDISEVEPTILEALEAQGNQLWNLKASDKEQESYKQQTNIEFQKLQEQLWSSQKSDEEKWRVSHFITLGSPLTYADFFMAKNREEFEERVFQREFPVSPPTDAYDQSNPSDFKYTYNKRSQETLHHAAVFAITKWTNIYYEGDIIGGELGPLFGLGVNDIKAEITGVNNPHRSLTSHVKYWDRIPSANNEALEVLREAIVPHMYPSPEGSTD